MQMQTIIWWYQVLNAVAIVVATVGGLAISNMTFSVPATTGRVLAGPFPPAIFNDANGDVHFTMSDELGLNFIAFKL